MRRLQQTLIALFGLCLVAAAGHAAVREYDLKAAFLYNFASFTEWSPSVATPMTFCVVGEDPFGKALDDLTTRQIRGLPVTVRRVSDQDNCQGCRVAFIPRASAAQLPEILARLGNQPVLTVSDIEGAAKRGVMIEITQDGSRLVFEINTAALSRSQLVVSSKLMKLARQVHTSL